MLTPNRRFFRRPSRVAVVTILFIAACVLPTALVMTSQTGNVMAQDEAAKPDTAADVANSSEEEKATNPSKLST